MDSKNVARAPELLRQVSHSPRMLGNVPVVPLFQVTMRAVVHRHMIRPPGA